MSLQPTAGENREGFVGWGRRQRYGDERKVSALKVLPVRSSARVLAVMSAAAVLLGLAAAPGHAVGEVPHDYALTPTVDSHFYTLNETRMTTDVGAPYVTVLGTHTVLSMDWDGELASTDTNTSAVQHLGTLALPARSRLLDFQYYSEWPATSARIPVMVSYAFLNEGSQCRYLVLRQASIDATGGGANTWGRVWFTSPCYPMVADEEGAFFLNQSGGRMALVPKGERAHPKQAEFMLGIGDFKSMVKPPAGIKPQALRTLGSIVRVSKPGRYEVVARGLRNTQGLVYGTMDGRPAVLATSQGPRGGDELVHVTQGADFGWPARNYGTAYRPGDSASRPQHEGAGGSPDLPLFAWLPSVGLSAAMQVKGPAFAQWWNPTTKGSTPDLILAGMGARWLYRVRIERGAVRYFEGLLLGARARSLAQLPDGRIVVGLDAGTEFLILSPGAAWNSAAGTKVAVS